MPVSLMAELETPHAVPAALLVLWRDARVLLLRCWDGGHETRSHGVVATDLDGSQPGTATLARRAREELGIIIVPDDLTLVHVLHRRADFQRVDLFFASRMWAGEPRIGPPDHCDELRWAELDRLPDDTAGHVRAGLEGMRRGRLFSALGWAPTP